MYAELGEPTVWATSTAPDDFSADELVAFLRRVADDTDSMSEIFRRLSRRSGPVSGCAQRARDQRYRDAAIAPGAIETEYA